MFGVKASNIIRPLCLKTSSQVYDVQPNLHAWEEAEGGLCVLEINCHSPGKTLSQKQTNKQTETKTTEKKEKLSGKGIRKKKSQYSHINVIMKPITLYANFNIKYMLKNSHFVK